MANLQKSKLILQQLSQKFKNPKVALASLKKIDPQVLFLLSIPTVVIIFVILITVSLIGRTSQGSAQTTPTNTSLPKPVAIAQINKDFSFSLKDGTGKKVGTFAFTAETAELDPQIIIQGARVSAISGRVFLVVNLKLTNTEDQGLQINTRNYIRLSVDGSSELLAPEIHNDPVEVQAISTKYTRVGFAVNQTAKTFVLKIGEIDGTKKDITLQFKKN